MPERFPPIAMTSPRNGPTPSKCNCRGAGTADQEFPKITDVNDLHRRRGVTTGVERARDVAAYLLAELTSP
jgi:hypothetical protein